MVGLPSRRQHRPPAQGPCLAPSALERTSPPPQCSQPKLPLRERRWPRWWWHRCPFLCPRQCLLPCCPPRANSSCTTSRLVRPQPSPVLPACRPNPACRLSVQVSPWNKAPQPVAAAPAHGAAGVPVPAAAPDSALAKPPAESNEESAYTVSNPEASPLPGLLGRIALQRMVIGIAAPRHRQSREVREGRHLFEWRDERPGRKDRHGTQVWHQKSRRQR